MKADLHIHTRFSYDAISSPAEVVRAAIDKRIDCICITDHSEIKGAIEAMKLGFDENILVIPGIEIFSKSGDILGINVKKKIPDGLSAEETIKIIRKEGGIAVIPHPFARPTLGFWGGREKLLRINVDAIEIFNASIIFKSENAKAFEFSRENNLAFTAGSDSHRAEFVGRGHIVIKEKILSEKDLIAAILNKEVGVAGKHLGWLELLKNGSNANIRRIIQDYRFKRRNRRENIIFEEV